MILSLRHPILCLCMLSHAVAAQSPQSTIWSGGDETQQPAPKVLQPSGHLNYSIPLPSLPSRAGHAPNLQLNYYQSAKDFGNGLGAGWHLNTSSIEIVPELRALLESLPAATPWTQAQQETHLALLEPLVKSFHKGQLTTDEAATKLLKALKESSR